jgi:hypothetical protein
MLAWRPDAQKPCPALSFQNAKQGLFAFQFNCAIRAKIEASAKLFISFRSKRPQHILLETVAAPHRAATALSESPQPQAPLKPPEERERRPPSASPGSR